MDKVFFCDLPKGAEFKTVNDLFTPNVIKTYRKGDKCYKGCSATLLSLSYMPTMAWANEIGKISIFTPYQRVYIN